MSPLDFAGGEFGVSPPAKRGEKILADFTPAPGGDSVFTPVFGRVPPRSGGGSGSPLPDSREGTLKSARGGTKVPPPVPPRLSHPRGENVLSPLVFREGGGELQKTVPPPLRGEKNHL